MTSVEKRAADLLTLADQINAEHRACEQAAATAVEHAIHCGEMLAEVKDNLKHGEWLPWLKTNFEGSRQTADVYRKLAANKDALNCQRASNLSIRGALTELEAEPTEKPTKAPYAQLWIPHEGGGRLARTYYTMEEYAQAHGLRISPPLLVDAEFHALLPPLRDSEYAGLEKSIVREGCRDAITAWNNTILDGHARYEICVKHGIDYLVRDVEISYRVEAMEYIIDVQMCRVNLSPYEIAYTRGKVAVSNLMRERGISEEQAWEEVLKEKSA